MKIDNKKYLSNYYKSLCMTFSVVALYILIISLFPVIGSIFSPGIPLSRIISENIALSLPLFLISVIISVILALALSVVKKRRIAVLISIGISGYILSVIFSMLYMADFRIAATDLANFAMLSFYSVMAFSVIVIPLVILAMILLEKWTREKNINS